MLRYTQDCPYCKGFGWHPCPGCKDPVRLPCVGRDAECPFSIGEENQILCNHCKGMGQLFITETKDGEGNLVVTEAPVSLSSLDNSIYLSIVEDFGESVGDMQELDSLAPQYEFVFDDELADDIASGVISDPVLACGIPKERFWVRGFRCKDTGKYPIVWGEYGFYFLSNDCYVHVDYSELEEVGEAPDRLVLKCTASSLSEEPQTFEIMRTFENQSYLRDLRLALNKIIRKESRHSDIRIQAILLYFIFEWHVGKLSKQGREYRFDPGSDPMTLKSPAEKRLHEVLFSYAAKIRRPHVIAFIDSANDGSNDRGIVFSQEGIAFCNGKNHGFIPYESIRFMTTNKKKTTLTLHGFFSECMKPCKKVVFNSADYNIDALEACFQELLRYV